ncbi:hypothetical protein [Rubrivirga sp. IMCC45206]|uniref:hypothetical protein n=1 Tax=Rubrivirga sp. IMCC45206 TaxID=3391614 RepID=UPI0039901757
MLSIIEFQRAVRDGVCPTCAQKAAPRAVLDFYGRTFDSVREVGDAAETLTQAIGENGDYGIYEDEVDDLIDSVRRLPGILQAVLLRQLGCEAFCYAG